MPKKRIPKISLIASLTAICLAATSWWVYITYTYNELTPLVFDRQKGYVTPDIGDDFFKNLRIVLEAEHIDYKLNVLDHPLVPLKTAMNQALICELTAKAQDVVWMYRHMHEKLPSFLYEGKGYQWLYSGKRQAMVRGLIMGTLYLLTLAVKTLN